MSYKLILKKRALKEYNESFSWYGQRSIQAGVNFDTQVKLILAKIEKQPDLFRKSYKKFREAKTKKFPYSIIYFIDEKENQIVITSIFHQKRNPGLKFKG
jgi:plasmid stabilization system protein ParE